MCQLMEERPWEINILNLEKLFRIGGPKIWIKIGNKMQDKSPYFAKMCRAMANKLELNEKSRDGRIQPTLLDTQKCMIDR